MTLNNYTKRLICLACLTFASHCLGSTQAANIEFEQNEKSAVGVRIDNLSIRPRQSVFSYHTAHLERGKVNIVALYEPGSGRSAIVPCYIGRLKNSQYPFVDRFDVRVFGENEAAAVVKMVKARRDPDAGAMPQLYSIVTPAIDTSPALGNFGTFGFALDVSKIAEHFDNAGRLRFPLIISLRFEVRIIENGVFPGKSEIVETGKCIITEDPSGRLQISSAPPGSSDKVKENSS